MFAYTESEKIVLPVALLVIILFAALIGYLLRKKSLRTREIPQTVLICVLLILEIVKQILSFEDGVYKNWSFPMHFCSTFLFLFALAAFGRGKLREFGKAASMIFCAMLLPAFYMGPTPIMGNATDNIFANYFSFHTFFYHQLVLLYFFFGIALRTYTPKLRDMLYIFFAVAGYFVLATIFAYGLNINFCYLLYSDFAIMESVRSALGQIGYVIIFLIVGVCYALFMWGIYYGINRLILHLKNKRKSI